MGVKILKLKKLFTDTKDRVLGKVSRLWISATIHHAFPCPMNFGATHPVGFLRTPAGKKLRKSAAARVRDTNLEGMRHGGFKISAVAPTYPCGPCLPSLVDICASLYYGESAESLPDKVYKSSLWHASMIPRTLLVYAFGVIIFGGLFCSSSKAQTLGLTPDFNQQFMGNNGLPLSGGSLLTCAAGASCPGTPLATYTDSSGFTANPSAVPLNANGRPVSGGIWLSCSANYKLVLRDSANVVIKTTDNVGCAAGGGGSSSTNYWQLSGTTISNTNAAGAGDVFIGGGLLVNNTVQANSGFILRSPGGTPHLATITAANVMTADQTWRWPASDVVGCLSSDGLGTLSFISCSGGGGGGSPGGNSSDVQYNSSGSFAGTDNFLWQNSAQRIVITGVAATPGVVVLNGWLQADGGVLAINNASPGTALAYNIIQAPTGGMNALSFTATKYVETGNNAGVPSATTGDAGYPHAGAMYCDTTSSPCTEKLYNGSAWISLATGGATSPGGSDTNIQFNSSGSFGGSGNLVWTAGAQRLTILGSSAALPAIHVATGYIESDAGFLALPGTAIRFNVIQAPAGGMAANSFTASTYIQSGHSPGPFSSAPPTPTTADAFAAGALSFDVASGIEQVFNGTSWVPLGGGGAGTPGGPTTSIQFNNGGSFLGSTNFTWNNSTRLAVINGLTNTAGLYVANSYAQSDIGFLAINGPSPSTPLTYNAIQAPTGGVYARSLRAISYAQTGNSSGIPAVTTSDTFTAGAMYYDTGLGTERLFNGSTWVSLGVGGVASVNTLTGTLTIAPTANQVNVSSVGSTITLSTPQNIATTSDVSFNTVTNASFFWSSATGASTTFRNGNGNFIVTGAGLTTTQTLNTLNTTGAAIQALNNTSVNSISTQGGITICSSGTCASGAALTVGGTSIINNFGFFLGAISSTIGGNSSQLWIGPLGNFYTRTFSTSTGATCGGVQDGWFAVSTSDLYLVACVNNLRYRVSLGSPF